MTCMPANADLRGTPHLWPTGTSAQHQIVAAARSAEARAHITSALHGVAPVRFLSSLAVLEPSHDAVTPLLGLLYLEAGDQPATALDWVATVYPFRARWTDVPVVAYAQYSVDVMRQCLHAGIAGASDLVVRGSHDLAAAITPILERRSAHPMIRAIIAAILQEHGPLGSPILGILRYAIEHVRERVTVDKPVGVSYLSRWILTNRLEYAGLESPERFLMWTRILVLAWLLRNDDYSVNRAIRILGFDAAALRHLVARYLEHSCEGLRGPHGVDHVVQAMLRERRRSFTILAVAQTIVLPAESLPERDRNGIMLPL